LTQVSNYEFNSYAIKNDTIKNGLIYGNNGSGKSNLSQALFDLIYHLADKKKLDDYYENYVCLLSDNTTVEFSYNFLLCRWARIFL
ncbi:MAG: hypothetical protein ACRC4W_01565, partial [Treponemataceae bacterium]